MAEFSQNLQQFDEYVEAIYRDWDIPGLAIGVVKDDELIFAKGYGVRKIGEPTSVDADTVFAIGSSSKAFTAAAVAMLVDEGKLKWDDMAADYLPDLRLFDAYVNSQLTVRDLLTHRSGLARTDFLWYGTTHNRNEILQKVRHIEPASSFRSAFGYQNVLYLAAGQLVPAVTGKSYDEFIQERFFQPLDMKASSTSVEDLDKVKNLASPHVKVGDNVQPVPWRNIDNIAPAGSINSNIQDMAQWLRFQLGEGVYHGETLIKPASFKETHTPQFVIRPEGEFALFWMLCPGMNFLTYGLGWFIQDYKGRKLVHHGGNIDGMSAMVSLMPAEKLGIVILTNLNGAVLNSVLHYSLFDALLPNERDKRDWSSETLKFKAGLEQENKQKGAKQASDRVGDTKPSLPLARYAGEYANKAQGTVKVGLENGKLILELNPGLVGDLEHWHFDTFQLILRNPMFSSRAGDVKTLVSFVLNADGKVAELKTPLTSDLKRVDEPEPDAPASEAEVPVQALEEANQA